MQLFTTRTYERAIRKLVSEETRKEMEMAIVIILTKPQSSGVREVFASYAGQALVGASEVASGQSISITPVWGAPICWLLMRKQIATI